MEDKEALAATAGRGGSRHEPSGGQLLADLPALISVPMAAKILGLTPATAYRYAAAGELPSRRFGGRRVYIVTARLREMIEHHDEDVV